MAADTDDVVAVDDRVTVIIPNYNNEKYLEGCLDSVLAQDYEGTRILVIDDASSDSSREILEEYQRKHDAVGVILNSSNLGVTKSRHKAILAAETGFITTLDSDDYYLRRDKISREVALVKSHADAGVDNVVAFSGISVINEHGAMRSLSSNAKEGDIFLDIISRSCMIPRDFLFTRKQYFEAGGFDEKIPIYEDWDLKIRLAGKNLFYFTGNDCIGYRRHGEGLSSADKSEHIKWLEYIFSKNLPLVDEDLQSKLSEEFHSRCIDPLRHPGNALKTVHNSFFNKVLKAIWKK